eukprot:14003475-Ditylum_brightwellii.AAC.1
MLPDNATFQTVQKFGTTILCKGPLTGAGDIACSNIAEATNLHGSFDNFLAHQPAHVRRVFGNLDAAHINVEYWIDALNKDTVTIATNGSVLDLKGYFAIVLHTNQRQLWFQGLCDGANSLMTFYQT